MPAVAALLQDPQGSFGGTCKMQNITRVYFTVTPSGNYAALGDTLDLSAVAAAAVTGRPPLFVQLESAKAGGVSGYQYSFTPNAAPTQANGKFQVLQTGAINSPAADIGAGAYPAGVLADTIIGYADFPSI